MNRAYHEHEMLEQATKHWKYVAPILSYPKNKADYELLIKRLDQLLDLVDGNENHPLIGLIDAVSNLVAMYEDKNLKKN